MDAIAKIEQQVAKLEQQVAEISRRLPPAGWEPANYQCAANPKLSVCRNMLTGQWSVWDGSGNEVSTGTSAAQAIARIPAGPTRPTIPGP